MVCFCLTRLGFSATLLGVPLFQFLYFGIYYNMKKYIHMKTKVQRDIISSMLTGSLCQVLTNPIWVVRIRMQSAILHLSPQYDEKNYSSIWKSFKTIYQNEGWIGLYKGNLVSQIGRRLGYRRCLACGYQHAFVRRYYPLVPGSQPGPTCQANHTADNYRFQCSQEYLLFLTQPVPA